MAIIAVIIAGIIIVPIVTYYFTVATVILVTVVLITVVLVSFGRSAVANSIPSFFVCRPDFCWLPLHFLKRCSYV